MFDIFLHVRHQIGVPYHFGKTEKTPGIDRSRGVRFHSAQEHRLTPSRHRDIEDTKSWILAKSTLKTSLKCRLEGKGLNMYWSIV